MFNVWIGNLGKYNEGELVGKWVELPCDDFDEVFDSIGINELYEETFIGDYENDYGIEVGEYDNLEQLNYYAAVLETMREDESVIEAIISYYGDIDDAIGVLDSGDYRVYYNCRSMGDVAYDFYEETGQLAEIEKTGLPSYYIDWDAIGRDFDLEGTFIEISNGYVEIYR